MTAFSEDVKALVAQKVSLTDEQFKAGLAAAAKSAVSAKPAYTDIGQAVKAVEAVPAQAKSLFSRLFGWLK